MQRPYEGPQANPDRCHVHFSRRYFGAGVTMEGVESRVVDWHYGGWDPSWEGLSFRIFTADGRLVFDGEVHAPDLTASLDVQIAPLLWAQESWPQCSVIAYLYPGDWYVVSRTRS